MINKLKPKLNTTVIWSTTLALTYPMSSAQFSMNSGLSGRGAKYYVFGAAPE